jgi:hypothetical protein
MTFRERAPAKGAMVDLPIQLRTPDDLFDQFDPSPLVSRRLNEGASAYLLTSLKQSAASGPVVVVVRLPDDARSDATEGALRASVPGHFHRLSKAVDSDIKLIRSTARRFVPIGFLIMCVCMTVSEILTIRTERLLFHSIAEGVLVLGWVALWAPFDYLLFGALPLTKKRSFYKRLANAGMRFQYTTCTSDKRDSDSSKLCAV